MGLPQIWGATVEEVAARWYAADRFAPDAAEYWFRAVPVRAPRPAVFRWLCQLRVAPYSYDLLDNRGRCSPRRLTPGAERLEVGQPVMTIFELVDFVTDEQLTLQMRAPVGLRLFGPFTITYAVRDQGPDGSRLIVKLLVGERGEPAAAAVRRRLLAWGDLVMMQRQLKTLGRLAET